MKFPDDVPIECQIVALVQEQNRLFAYPADVLAGEIRRLGFSCTCCGACCTRAVGSHIFLLDRDIAVLDTIDRAGYVPAPDPEFCDNNGRLYASGYALRMRGGNRVGACWFLEDGRCRIYDQRFLACRVYPHMLRRVTGDDGSEEWLHLAHKNEHGRHDASLSHEESVAIAQEVLELENALLVRQISFLEAVNEYFTMHGLRHDPDKHTEMSSRFKKGLPVDISVFHNGELVDYRPSL
jgi:Fe-S-cluster containining protein